MVLRRFSGQAGWRAPAVPLDRGGTERTMAGPSPQRPPSGTHRQLRLPPRRASAEQERRTATAALSQLQAEAWRLPAVICPSEEPSHDEDEPHEGAHQQRRTEQQRKQDGPDVNGTPQPGPRADLLALAIHWRGLDEFDGPALAFELLTLGLRRGPRLLDDHGQVALAGP
jgi:hypothetical protein